MEVCPDLSSLLHLLAIKLRAQCHIPESNPNVTTAFPVTTAFLSKVAFQFCFPTDF